MYFDLISLKSVANDPTDSKSALVQLLVLMATKFSDILREETSNYTPQYLFDVITRPRSWYLLLATLRWRHNGPDCVSNHQPHDCLLNRLFQHRSKKTSKLRVTGLCVGNSPGTGEFPAQRASYAENVSIWWRHHDIFPNVFLKCQSQVYKCTRVHLYTYSFHIQPHVTIPIRCVRFR